MIKSSDNSIPADVQEVLESLGTLGNFEAYHNHYHNQGTSDVSAAINAVEEISEALHNFAHEHAQPIDPIAADAVADVMHSFENAVQTAGAGATIADGIPSMVDNLPFSNDLIDPVLPNIGDAMGVISEAMGGAENTGTPMPDFGGTLQDVIDIVSEVTGGAENTGIPMPDLDLGGVLQDAMDAATEAVNGSEGNGELPNADFVTGTAQDAANIINDIMGTGTSGTGGIANSSISAVAETAGAAAAVAAGLGNDIKMDTDAVRSAADNIATLNGDMKDSLIELSKTIGNLRSSWEGKAAETCIGKFNDMNSAYGESRHTVINNVVLFLKQQIGEGYEETEKVNVSLADYFK